MKWFILAGSCRIEPLILIELNFVFAHFSLQNAFDDAVDSFRIRPVRIRRKRHTDTHWTYDVNDENACNGVDFSLMHVFA